MKKELFSFLMALCMCVAGAAAVSAGDAYLFADALTYGDLQYAVSGGNVTITGCDKNAANVTIPSSIDSMPVTAIRWDAFRNCSALSAITIPDSVTSIGDNAFRSCSELAKAVIGNGVTSIGESAFRDCGKLVAVEIGTKITAIRSSAFLGSNRFTDIYYRGSSTAWNDVNIEPDIQQRISDGKVTVHYNSRIPDGTGETFTVTFDANGGSVSTTSKTVTQGKTYGDLPTPTWTNHDFLGWFSSPDGGTQIKSGSTVNLSGDQTLYAHWDYNPPPTPTTYTVTFDANGGSGSMPSRKVADDGEFTLPACKFTPPPDLEFDGWLVNGTVYQPGDTLQLDADAVAVAQWYGVAVSDILSNWGAVRVQLSNAVRKPVAVAVCAYSDAGQMLSCAVCIIDSGSTADLKPDISGAAYLQAFLLSPDTSAPLGVPFRKNLG